MLYDLKPMEYLSMNAFFLSNFSSILQFLLGFPFTVYITLFIPQFLNQNYFSSDLPSFIEATRESAVFLSIMKSNM